MESIGIAWLLHINQKHIVIRSQESFQKLSNAAKGEMLALFHVVKHLSSLNYNNISIPHELKTSTGPSQTKGVSH